MKVWTVHTEGSPYWGVPSTAIVPLVHYFIWAFGDSTGSGVPSREIKEQGIAALDISILQDARSTSTHRPVQNYVSASSDEVVTISVEIKPWSENLLPSITTRSIEWLASSHCFGFSSLLLSLSNPYGGSVHGARGLCKFRKGHSWFIKRTCCLQSLHNAWGPGMLTCCWMQYFYPILHASMIPAVHASKTISMTAWTCMDWGVTNHRHTNTNYSEVAQAAAHCSIIERAVLKRQPIMNQALLAVLHQGRYPGRCWDYLLGTCLWNIS